MGEARFNAIQLKKSLLALSKNKGRYFSTQNTVSKNIKPVKIPCILFFKKSPEISTV